MRFSIIVPNYNNGPWLDKCLESIANQKYKNFELIFVDDMSADDSVEIYRRWADKMPTATLAKLSRKRYNGGARNAGMMWRRGQYTLFMDSDDWLADDMCFSAIDDAIRANNEPDLIRLSYYFCMSQDEHVVDLSAQNTIDKIVPDINVACWTKCVKSDKLVQFPENTLMEDVVQHIAQLDAVDTVAVCDKPIVKWNRNNTNSCSKNNGPQGNKWRSSLYRYYADLLDLKVNKQECQIELDRRRSQALDNIRNDRFEQ